MDKFSTKVRTFIREYVPEGSSSLEDFEIAISNTDSLREAMEGMLAKPTRKNMDDVHETAYDYAVSQLDEYRCEQRLIGTIATAHQAVIQEHLEKVNAIEQVPLKEGAGPTSSGTNLLRGAEREELLEQANMSARARKKILHDDVRPLQIVLKRCQTLIKALTSRAKSEFPSAVKPLGWFPENPISDSSDPIKNPLVGESHEVCRLFADGQYKKFNDLLNQRETGKTAAKQRAERKKARTEQRALEAERTKDLMAIRKARKSKFQDEMARINS